ncbi:SCAN domain-containing protein 3-like, partial [Acyrthosiphon pisum]|uniref:Integrase catalytic domain-containing protein n=1 Tax=Acyrthosiphon pisum TaxID=7029 RepID=A0A8R2BB22_ACYPI
KESKSVNVKKSIHYRRLKRFDIVKIGAEEKLIAPMNSDSEEMRYYVRYNELYDIIHEAHIATGRGGRNRIVYAVNNHLTKFVILRPLKFKRAEVAYCLLDIFTLFGAPNILHSDNGREFVNAVITNLCSMWPEVKIVHGKARHSQSQGSVERANQDIERIKRSPYEAMFGIKMKMELANSIIPKNVLPGLQTEEDLEAALTEPIFENEEVEINKDDETLANENLEIRDVENVIPVRTQKINQHREESHIGLQKQARKMKEMSNKQMPTILIRQTVKVKIPEVDRSKVDARTLLAVVLKVVDGEFYRL